MILRWPRMGLRTIAVLIAIAALIDPAWSSNSPPARELIAIRLASADTSRVETALQQQLRDWTVTGREVTAGHLPCAPSEHCVVIADGTLDAAVPSDVGRPVPVIAIRAGEGPNVDVRSVQVSAGHQSAAGTARVELASRQMKGRATELRILDGSAIVGSSQFEWADIDTATVNIAWWPIGTGARTLRIEAVPQAGEITTDNAIDVGVSIGSERAPVLVFDARPSWSSTFVRRALEDDPRFAIEYRARIAPALEAGTARARLDAAALDRAAVVIVGGLDALTPGDVALLDRFTRVRGGTLILLPERVPAQSMAPIVAGTWAEHLVAEPERIGTLRASEILQLRSPLAATTTVLGRSGSLASIVSTPAGDGRIVVSGAMDAWRYRHLDSNAFDTFWRSLVADGAVAGAALRVTFDRDLATRGSRSQVSLRHRSMTPPATLEAAAVWRCEDGAARSIRMWPTGTLGDFVGDLPTRLAGACVLEATIADRVVSAGTVVAERPARSAGVTLAKLERAAVTSGAVVTSAGDEASIARAVAAASPDSSQIVSVYPMRTIWWLLPFAGCLSIEWWLRRRAGLR